MTSNKASIAVAIEACPKNRICQFSYIAKYYFNCDFTCKKRSRGKFCRTCSKILITYLEHNGDFDYYNKNFKCEFTRKSGSKVRPLPINCSKIRITSHYCKTHSCWRCRDLKLNQDNAFYAFLILALYRSEYKIPKDVLRYVIFPKFKLKRFHSHYFDDDTAELFEKYNRKHIDYILCPNNLFKCKYCSVIENPDSFWDQNYGETCKIAKSCYMCHTKSTGPYDLIKL